MPQVPPFEPPIRSTPPAPGGTPAFGGAPAPPFAPPAPPPVPREATTTTGVPHYSPPAAPGVAETAAAPARGPRERRSVWRPLGRAARELAETVILAVLIFLLVRSVVQNFQVEGRSMEPTLEDSWYLLVNKAIYWEINVETLSKFLPFFDPGADPDRYLFRAPKRGDIIVFRSPNQGPGEPERDFIKRVIGLPGETVEVRNCTVYIDNEPLEEPYVAELATYSYGPEKVPAGHYFVLGDNRNNSSDSHSWGMLPKDKIIGRAWITYWPFSAFGLVDGTSVEPGAVSADAPKQVSACP
jgi:signal peptidase I